MLEEQIPSITVAQLNTIVSRRIDPADSAVLPELDEWLRRRIRMCYWQQWRWARTKIRHLLVLGVSLKSAIRHGVSSHGYWHMARTPVTQQAMSNAEPGHKASSGRLVPGEGSGHWPDAACKAG